MKKDRRRGKRRFLFSVPCNFVTGLCIRCFLGKAASQIPVLSPLVNHGRLLCSTVVLRRYRQELLGSEN